MKIVIAHDAVGWAQNLHSEGLRKFAPKGLSVTTQLLSAPIPRDAETVYTINMASCRKIPGVRTVLCCASHAWKYQANDPNNWRTRGVNPKRNSIVGQVHLSQADAVVCRNTALEAWASLHTDNAKYIPAGIDPELWHPGGRVPNTGRKLRVGWSGQVNPEMSGRFKGFDEIYLPLKSMLGEQYEFVDNTRTANEALSWSEMREWYASLDVFLTTASAEGTPNASFISAACGAVVISTDVGQVSDWSSLKHAGLVVPSYGNEEEACSTKMWISVLLKSLEDPHVRSAKQEMLLASIEHSYSYKVLAKPTLEFVTGTKL
jgi:glycosyltransferase involved in cell wall biosynthesis